jgi:4-hydroxy-4-methyl-2-oxoglutarate aldolase
MTIAAIERGAVGLIIDGAVRDVQSAARLGFPVFCAGISMKASGKNFKGRINVPITCGGVLVNPGDLVVGDADGVVVVPNKDVDQVLKKARERERKEAGLIEQLRKGALTIHLLGLSEKIKE